MAGPGGCWRQGPEAAIIEVEDVDGGPPGGVGSKVRQRPPPKLKTSMVGPWEVRRQGPTAAITEVEDVDGGPPRWCWRQGPAAATTEVEDIDGDPPEGCWQQGPVVATTEVEDVDGGPQEVSELKIREHNAFEACLSSMAVNGCRNL
jgi:hypothetical protein